MNFFGYNTEFNFDRYDLGVMMNAVLLAVIVMVGLSLVRVHVVLSLVVGALVGGLMAGMSVADTLTSFQDGIKNGAQIALSYAMLGAFAMAIAHSGLPQILADKLIARLQYADGTGGLKFLLFFYLNYYGNHVSKHCADSYCLYSPNRAATVIGDESLASGSPCDHMYFNFWFGQYIHVYSLWIWRYFFESNYP